MRKKARRRVQKKGNHMERVSCLKLLKRLKRRVDGAGNHKLRLKIRPMKSTRIRKQNGVAL